MPHVEVEIRDRRRRPVPAGPAGRDLRARPQHLRRLLRGPGADGSDLRRRRLGPLRRSGGPSTTTATSRVVGRKKEIIIRGGLNIAPREIEDLLLGFPEVERAAVVGLPDERLGERMCACVVLRAGTELDLADAVEPAARAGLATYKLPERLEVVDALPTTASGKVQKHLLVAELTR